MDNFFLLLAVGLVAGVLSGLFGIGGGIVIVPALTLLVAFSAKTAVATSLAALLLPVGIFAVLEYHKKGLLDLRASAIVALGLVTTTLIGAQITLALPETLFKQAYGVFVVVMGLRFLGVFARNTGPAAASPAATGIDGQAQGEVPQNTSGEPAENVAGVNPDSLPAAMSLSTQPSAVRLIALGLVAGVLSGMFGIGGGIVIVPALMTMFGMPQKRAVGTSLGALLLPVGLPGVLGYYAAGELNLGAALPVAAGLAIGALGGARIAIGLDPNVMRRMYGIFLLIVGVWFILQPVAQ